MNNEIDKDFWGDDLKDGDFDVWYSIWIVFRFIKNV